VNRVGRLLPLNHVLLGLDVSSKKRLFEQIGLAFENSRHIPRARVFDSLFDREKLGSTALGYGVAIPHGRIKTIKEPVCAFVRISRSSPSLPRCSATRPCARASPRRRMPRARTG
jgi:PTS system nitrogen regulatory IIA component